LYQIWTYGIEGVFKDPNNNFVGYGLFVHPAGLGFEYMPFEDRDAVILLRRYHTFIDNYASGLADWLVDVHIKYF
jgi:hypothetical protein